MANGINEEFFNVPLNLLSVPTLRVISTLLNPVKFLPTNDNLPRDWRGLADLTGCNNEEVSSFNTSSDPTLSVLKRWCEQDSSSIKMLLVYFQKLDRYDIYDDIIALTVSDINDHRSNTRSNVDTSLFITSKDHEHYRQGLSLKKYDASILYAHEDRDFAAEIVTKLEEIYKLNIFIKERDLIGGTIEHDATMKIIAKRSKRLIIILSPAFLRSSENKYFLSFAQSIGIEKKVRKIIPCIYEDCEIPLELGPLHKLYYRNTSVLYNFYDKLYTSIIQADTAENRRALPVNQESSTMSISMPRMDSLTVPQIIPKSIKEHSSLPDLNDNSDERSVQKDFEDTISRVSLPNEKQTKKSKITKFFQKKIFKQKKKLADTSLQENALPS